jgi:hypothetical protein
MGFY